ncbi:MAG: glycosyl hydrolase family 65 protein [Candidatus Deferrimicrobiaceae bacterium]
MIYEERINPPEYIYPREEWRFVESRFEPSFLEAAETLFSTANGYFGIRGSFEEGAPAYMNGTYINAFYESWPIVYPEKAYGFAKTGQSIVNVPDARLIRLYVDDEPFYLPTANLLGFERSLDMRQGTLDRKVLWEMPSGKRISVESRRLVSFRHRHLAAISYEVTVRNAEAPVVISSEMVLPGNREEGDEDPRRGRTFSGKVFTPAEVRARDGRIVWGLQTMHSKMALASGVDHVIQTECPYSQTVEHADGAGRIVYSIDAKPEIPIRLIKYITYHTSRSTLPFELMDRAGRTLDRAVAHGFEDLLTEQRTFMDAFWLRSDLEVRGDPELQQIIRFNLYQICQATARAEGAGIPAKGLTGEGYEGHYFWDAEIYVLPFLIYTEPRIARNMLLFRYSMLDKARKRAREVNQKGALFPWRTINGDEASAYYAAGTAQYHINADIMHGLKKYVEVTGDETFLYREGAEMLVETARLWLDLGFFSEFREGQFCINGVTGPDEYNTVVNNNAFTNLMARNNLRFAAETVETLREKDPGTFRALADRTGLAMTEVAEWKNAADRMFVPYDEEKGIHLQDDSFLERERWDFENTPREKYPLLLYHHPLVIYRRQVIKQADVVLAMFLLGNEFTEEQKKRNFDFYDPLTTGDSSLSACIQCILACETGALEKAARYARYAALVDLRDIAGNVRDGLHIASIGGTWMAFVHGFAGMRDYYGRLSFRPRLPRKAKTKGFRFRLQVRGQLLEVNFDRDTEQVTYQLLAGIRLTIEHFGEEVGLSVGVPVVRDLQFSE